MIGYHITKVKSTFTNTFICRFFGDPGYREYLENVVSFNRKLNEERKNRLPYIDSQTGMAQGHYNSERNRRERMPGLRQGQIYSYPQRQWRKRKYQYLGYFMASKAAKFPNPESDEVISSVADVVPASTAITNTTITTPTTNGISTEEPMIEYKDDDLYYDEDGFILDDELDAGAKGGGNSDSDFEYGDSYSSRSKKTKGRGRGRGRSKR